MAVRGLDHVNISTTDLDATRDFFVDVLGFEVGWRPALSFPGAWLYAAGTDLVHLVQVKDAPAPSRGSALDHFAFAIDDYEDAKARLDSRGLTYRELAPPGDTGIRQLFLTDLNGVAIELNYRP